MVDQVLFEATKGDDAPNAEWETPEDLFQALDAEFHFDIDAAASEANAKCDFYITKEQDALNCDWSIPDNTLPAHAWLNPPYGRGVKKWVAKAWQECVKGNLVVLLLPARTDTEWFHQYIDKKAEVRFLKGRIRFVNSDTAEPSDPAPFPSMIVVFEPRG